MFVGCLQTMSNPLASPAAMASHFSGIKRESEGDKDGDQQSPKGESNPSKKLRILPPPLTWEQLPENRAAQEEVCSVQHRPHTHTRTYPHTPKPA